jgi:TRAP-type mannitol/chloroaromatic compound transport system substrate-binding protein
LRVEARDHAGRRQFGQAGACLHARRIGDGREVATHERSAPGRDDGGHGSVGLRRPWQQLAGGDIYPALEKGTIDATEWIGPYDDQKLGFNKVAKNYYYPGWWEGGPQLSLYVNSKALAALPKEYQAIVEAAASHAHVDMQAKYDGRNPGALKQLVASGVKVLPFPKAVMDEAFAQSMSLYTELNDTNPKWKKVYSDYSAFRKDQNLWFRFTEAQFDRYMQSAKL